MTSPRSTPLETTFCFPSHFTQSSVPSQLRRFLPVEDHSPSKLELSDPPLVSELGYDLWLPSHGKPQVPTTCREALTSLSVAILADGATEPPYSRVQACARHHVKVSHCLHSLIRLCEPSQADGKAWRTDEPRLRGVFISPLSGAPLLRSEDAVGVGATGWPAFRCLDCAYSMPYQGLADREARFAQDAQRK